MEHFHFIENLWFFNKKPNNFHLKKIGEKYFGAKQLPFLTNSNIYLISASKGSWSFVLGTSYLNKYDYFLIGGESGNTCLNTTSNTIGLKLSLISVVKQM